MELSETVVIAIVLTIAIIITVSVFIYLRYTRGKEPPQAKKFTWTPIQDNKYDTHEDLRAFSLNSKDCIKFKKGDGFELLLPDYDKFSELCVYSYPDMNMVRTVPYPVHVKISCPGTIPPGEYTFILRCKGPGLEDWLTKPTFELKKIEQPHITQSAMGMNYSDSGSYDSLGLYYQSIVMHRNDDLVSNIVSENLPLYPLSVYIHHERAEFNLESSQNAVVIVPNRLRTMRCADTLFVNDSILEGNNDDGFNSYEISGREHPRVTIDQYIFGNASIDMLPFYVYIFA